MGLRMGRHWPMLGPALREGGLGLGWGSQGGCCCQAVQAPAHAWPLPDTGLTTSRGDQPTPWWPLPRVSSKQCLLYATFYRQKVFIWVLIYHFLTAALSFPLVSQSSWSLGLCWSSLFPDWLLWGSSSASTLSVTPSSARKEGNLLS